MKTERPKFGSTRASVLLLTFAALLTAVPAWLGGAAAHAGTELKCTIRSVHDGDSMRVQCPNQRATLRVRMQQIDAPELEQAYGIQARDHLRKLCRTGSVATIRVQGRDQYGRILGNVHCGNKNVNEEMVASGSAWIYDRYVEEHGLYRLQDRARAEKRGLWAGRSPQAPWRWRHEQRQRN